MKYSFLHCVLSQYIYIHEAVIAQRWC